MGVVDIILLVFLLIVLIVGVWGFLYYAYKE